MIDIFTLQFVFGLLATTFIVTGMFLKTRKNILLLKLSADISWVLAFVVQGAMAGTIAMIFTTMRTFFGRNFAQLRSIGMFLWLCSVVLTLIFWKGFYDVFSLIGLTFVTIAVYVNNPKIVKLFIMMAAISWCFYGYFIGYFEIILFEFCIIIAGMINIYRKS
ncbi:MAG: YgjV family protein [Sulfurospirillaceae bacterium]|nr:YgjV family protein [Sulfurospirillaceae bacterium]